MLNFPTGKKNCMSGECRGGGGGFSPSQHRQCITSGSRCNAQGAGPGSSLPHLRGPCLAKGSLGSPDRGTVPREGPGQGAAPTKLCREPGHRDQQLGVSGDTSAVTGWGHVLRSWVLIVISVVANFGQIYSSLLQEPWENWHWILPAKDRTAQFLFYTFYLQQIK